MVFLTVLDFGLFAEGARLLFPFKLIVMFDSSRDFFFFCSILRSSWSR